MERSIDKRIENSIRAISIAKNNGVSVSNACKSIGLPPNYVRNTKFTIISSGKRYSKDENCQNFLRIYSDYVLS